VQTSSTGRRLFCTVLPIQNFLANVHFLFWQFPTMATASPTRRVLIVDESEENREVLRTILQRHGVETIEACDAEGGLRLAKDWHPSVMVLDVDTIDLSDTRACGDFDDEARLENTSVVLLGGIRAEKTTLSNSEVLPKPYHYAPLIRKIEELLQAAQ